MPAPRVFVSSTFYDLRQLRSDLELFIRELGYEPVLHESGAIPYGSDEPLENFAVRTASESDILVAVVGGRFGSESEAGDYSISQNELKAALDARRQVYVFVEQAVFTEHQTYQVNRDNVAVNYKHVDDVRVFHFLDEIAALPQNNQTVPFATARDITEHLRHQFAGLFQRLLQAEAHKTETRSFADLQESLKTVRELVTFLTADRENKEEAIQTILTANHPLGARIKNLLGIPYRVYLTSQEDLTDLLGARSFRPVDDFDALIADSLAWSRRNQDGSTSKLMVSKEVFDEDGRVRFVTENEWNEDWAILVEEPPPVPADDDIPF